jgi:hypothetical protein
MAGAGIVAGDAGRVGPSAERLFAAGIACYHRATSRFPPRPNPPIRMNASLFAFLSRRPRQGAVLAAALILVLAVAVPALAAGPDVIDLGAEPDSNPADVSPAPAPGAAPSGPLVPGAIVPGPTAAPNNPDVLSVPGAPAPATAPADQPPASAGTPVPPEPGRVANPVAVFNGLDKITGRITSFDVYIDETVQFGSLQVTPRVCYNRPPTLAPQTDSFVEVDEIGLDRKVKRIFTGWMYAASPGLHAVDNPVYDVWLTDCKVKSSVPPPKK